MGAACDEAASDGGGEIAFFPGDFADALDGFGFEEGLLRGARETVEWERPAAAAMSWMEIFHKRVHAWGGGWASQESGGATAKGLVKRSEGGLGVDKDGGVGYITQSLNTYACLKPGCGRSL